MKGVNDYECKCKFHHVRRYPAVSELNKVPGFNPLKFLRKTADGPKLDLKYRNSGSG
jgi:hypothetical protein